MKNILERMDDQKEEQKDLREMFRAFMDKSEKHEEAMREQNSRIERILEKTEKHESETNAEFERVNRRVDEIEERIAASQGDKVSFEEGILKVEEIARVSSKLAENVAEKNLRLEQIMEEHEQRLEENFRQKFFGAREARSTFTDLARSLEDLRGELAEVKEGSVQRWQRAFDPGEGRSSLRGGIESERRPRSDSEE